MAAFDVVAGIVETAVAADSAQNVELNITDLIARLRALAPNRRARRVPGRAVSTETESGVRFTCLAVLLVDILRTLLGGCSNKKESLEERESTNGRGSAFRRGLFDFNQKNKSLNCSP